MSLFRKSSYQHVSKGQRITSISMCIANYNGDGWILQSHPQEIIYVEKLTMESEVCKRTLYHPR